MEDQHINLFEKITEEFFTDMIYEREQMLIAKNKFNGMIFLKSSNTPYHCGYRGWGDIIVLIWFIYNFVHHSYVQLLLSTFTSITL